MPGGSNSGVHRVDTKVQSLTSGLVLRMAPRRAADSRVPARGWVLLMALMPVVDPVVNQLNNAVPLYIGPYSLLQVLRGAVLMVLLVYALLAEQRDERSTATGWISVTVAVCLAVFALNEFYSRGELPLGSVVAGVQILYWTLAWHVATLVIRDRAGAAMVARGLLAGALVTAVSVFYAYVADAPSLYRTQGIEASAGWFTSAKGIAGTLGAGALLAGYLAWHSRKALYYAAAALCVCALLLTYARAGIVAVCCALAWLLIWVASGGFGRQSVWARRMLVSSVIAGGLFFYRAGTESIVRRWSDLQQPGYAGSGRLILWQAAVQRFLDGSATEQVFGIGYSGMLDLTERATGLRLHTHNDPMDLLLMGGMAGMVVLAVVLGGIAWQIRRIPYRSPEFAVAIAVLIVLLVQGCLTGQIFLPDVMVYYLLALTAVNAIGAGMGGSVRRRVLLVPDSVEAR